MNGIDLETLIEVPRIKCSKCTIITNHQVLHNFQPRITERDEYYQNFGTLQCHNCGTVIFRIERFKLRKRSMTGPSEPEKVAEMIFPNTEILTDKSWYVHVSQEILEILKESFQAYEANLLTLASIGIRTVIDMAIVEKVGDKGTFKVKIDKTFSDGIIGQSEKDMMEMLVDAGSASAHRGFRPSRAFVDNLFSISDKILFSMFAKEKEEERVAKVVQEMKGEIPKR